MHNQMSSEILLFSFDFLSFAAKKCIFARTDIFPCENQAISDKADVLSKSEKGSFAKAKARKNQ